MPWPKLPPLDDEGSSLLLALSHEWDALSESGPEFLAKVYRHFTALYGEEEATRLFTETVPKKGRGEHGPWQNLLPNRDAFLLREYDQARRGLAPKLIARLPRVLGYLLDRAAPGKFGNSAAAIERHIRRLVSRRKLPARGGTLLSQYGK